MKHWNEVRTMLQVAKLGSISAASQILNIHRATVLRHLDTLEEELETKLFVRGANGYTLTDAGKELSRIAEVTQEQLDSFSSRANGLGESLTGEFVITSLEPMVDALMPALKTFRKEHPNINIHYIAAESAKKLEYGQIHVAVRSGPKPSHDDYVVRPFISTSFVFCAHRDYLSHRGTPRSLSELMKHDFIVSDVANPKFEILKWMKDNIHEKQHILSSSNQKVRFNAMKAGMGISICNEQDRKENPELIAVMPDQLHWELNSWVVTHGDLHRSPKVQAFLNILKSKSYKDLLKSEYGITVKL